MASAAAVFNLEFDINQKIGKFFIEYIGAGGWVFSFLEEFFEFCYE